jgi:hypothetical protein
MKKIIITLVTAISSTCVVAQSSFKLFETGTNITAKSSYTLIEDTSKEAFLEFDCQNISSSTKQTKVQMTIVSTPNGCSNDIYFCDKGGCYLPGTLLSPVKTTTPAGKRDTLALMPHVDKGSCTGLYKLHLRLFDINNIADSVSVDFEVTVVTGIDENINRDYLLGNAVPNPASENVTIDYTFITEPKTATLEVYNMIGVKVNDYKIQGMEGKINMNVSELPNGIYFYSLLIDKNKINTKKVVVSH